MTGPPSRGGLENNKSFPHIKQLVTSSCHGNLSDPVLHGYLKLEYVRRQFLQDVVWEIHLLELGFPENGDGVGKTLDQVQGSSTDLLQRRRGSYERQQINHSFSMYIEDNTHATHSLFISLPVAVWTKVLPGDRPRGQGRRRVCSCRRWESWGTWSSAGWSWTSWSAGCQTRPTPPASAGLSS